MRFIRTSIALLTQKEAIQQKSKRLAWLDNHQQGAIFTTRPLKSRNPREEISTSKTAWHGIKIMVPS
jgi:hypothetical protein